MLAFCNLAKKQFTTSGTAISKRNFHSSINTKAKVTVCGASGGIGQPLSLLLKQDLPQGSVLSLYDVVNVKGVGADISHVSTPVKIEAYLGDMKNPANEALNNALKGSDVVVIPAGVPRKPGMTRDDLFKVNAGIVRDIIASAAKQCPNALIAIITNPVNSTVPIAAEVLKQNKVYNPKRLFGVSTLDVVRAQTFIGDLKKLDPKKVKIDVVGGHSPETMLPILSQVQGVKFTEEEIKKLTTDIREAGTVVVNAKEGTGSATLSMAYAGARFALSLVRALNGEKGIVECTYVAVEKMDATFCAVPVELGKEGVARILPVPKMSAYEQEEWKKAMAVLKKNIETGVTFASAK